jgi:hypothetical protein
LNAPRGIALDAVIDYAFWIHPYDQKEFETGESAFSDAPEVKVLLEKVVTTDSSLAAGEVLGRRFPNLFALDRAWANENVDRIFKPEAKLVERVAWINYILFCQASRSTNERLTLWVQISIPLSKTNTREIWSLIWRASFGEGA